MSEFWEWYAARSDADDASAKKRLKSAKIDAVLWREGAWLYICAKSDKAARVADVVVHFSDHEGSAWSLGIYKGGQRIGKGVFDENVETGAHNQGFDGDIGAAAAALGVSAARLKEVLVPDSSAFLKLLGLTALPMDPSQIPPGVHFIDELE